MISLNVNGAVHATDADPATPLLYVLRDVQKTPNPTEAQIRAHMSPNLCRCGTGEPFLGTGEASQGPAGAALANALADATGVRVRELPLSAARVKAAIGA